MRVFAFFCEFAHTQNMEVSSGHDRVAEIHHQLVFESDGVIRAALHLELATLAVSNGRFESAAVHFREALFLDGRIERARTGLHELGEKLHPEKPRSGRVRSWFGRLRGRR